MEANFHYWTLGTLPMWINDHILKKTKKDCLLIFQIYLSFCNRIPLNVKKNNSRGFKFYIGITNIGIMYNWSAIQCWPKGSLPLTGYRIPIYPVVYLATSMAELWRLWQKVWESWIQNGPRVKSTIQVSFTIIWLMTTGDKQKINNHITHQHNQLSGEKDLWKIQTLSMTDL